MNEKKKTSGAKKPFVKIMAWILVVLMVAGTATTALIFILQNFLA